MSKLFQSVIGSRIEGRITSWVTCYDFSFATAVERSSVDMVLVGDSGAMVALGENDTSPATMDDMIRFARSVRNGTHSKPIVGDMPRGSYEASDITALDNAMRFCKEAGCEAVKLEGGGRVSKRVAAIVDAGIPTIGHIGLTPQSASQLGGYRVVGRAEIEQEVLVRDALALEQAGACAILVEAALPSTAQAIRDNVALPIFGIGSGPSLDGQLLILHDLLGLYPSFRPKFAKNYVPEVMSGFFKFLTEEADLVTYGRETRRDGILQLATRALDMFAEEVTSGAFPSEQYSYS